MTVIKRASRISESNIVIVCSNADELKKYSLSASDIDYFKNASATERKTATIVTPQGSLVVIFKDRKMERIKLAETLRKAGAALITFFNDNKIHSVELADATGNNEHLLLVAEGIVLANYQFLKYKTSGKDKEKNSLDEVVLVGTGLKEQDVNHLRIATEATFIARDLVNEPVITINAETLSDEFRKLGKDAGFRVEVLNKAKIIALKMGGLLAVNKGSDIPPTFTIMEHKPARPRNKKPIVLVGKGVVFDTGGYNIKVGTGMETMKCDMAGAAAVGGIMWAVAKAKLNVHVIGIVPATDNRIDGSGYVAGDVLTMYNGKTVEVLNTDAEGRLILGDALSYAEKYEPGLVIDFATLTGAAMVAIGPAGIVSMGTAGTEVKKALANSGNRVYERLAEFPFWDEYDEMIRSDVADIKNIGGAYAGAITAGKFLAHFVKAPWMHFDIAGPAFLAAKDGYRTKGGTGVGVRLMFDFLSSYKG